MPAVKYSNRTIKSNLPSCFWEALKEVPRKPKEIQQKKEYEKPKENNKKNLCRKISPTSNSFFFRFLWFPAKVKQKLSKTHKEVKSK